MQNKLRIILQKHKIKLPIALSFIILGILSRTVFHIAPNVEMITVISLLAGFYLGGIYIILVPLASLVGSDMIIGNSNIFLFTWSAYILGGILGLILRLFKVNKKVVLIGSGAGLVFSVFFYLYSNFGVWLITPWYDRSLSGLLYCYYMGLPFLRLNLIGNMIFVPIGFAIAELIKSKAYQKQSIVLNRKTNRISNTKI
ncbi:hypothetical protein KKG41_00340 [Patescibacteria group bacterium]|nr:hypothetical protein [Patescibacteria group bacterium]MBU1890190.1 hypothetical protein [Patescibacteria group bacterium]